MSSDGNATGVVDDPQGGFQLGGDLTEAAAVSLDAFVDILIGFFRVYLITTTSIFIPILLFFVVSYYAGLWPSSYGSEMMIRRIRRSSTGLFAISVILPILYLSMWFLTGTESHDGRAADLPSSGVFGTSWEERLIGPEPASGGLGMLADIFVSIFYTYQVTVTFVLISILVFASVIFLVMKWPSEVDPLVRRDRVYRISFGMLVSFSILPVLYAISWIATGWYTPNESFTRVSPQISLPYDSLFGGSQHPFLEQLAAESDPLEVTLQNVLSLHVETLLFVGILAIVFGSILFVFLGRSNYFQTNLGQQSFRGGVIIVLVLLLAPTILAGGAWLATGVASGVDLGEGPPGFTSQCQEFKDGEMGAWSASSGSAQIQPDGWSLRIDGTLERSVSAANHADRMVSITPAQDSYGEDEFHIQMYDGDELVLNETTTYRASFTEEIQGDATIQISSDGGELDRLCTGFQTVALPTIALEMDAPEEVILREGIDIDYSVYNVGHVPTGEAFDVGVYANGTGFLGEHTEASQTWRQDPLTGGEFSHEQVSFDGLIDARAVGEVVIVTEVDPNGEMSQRTTVPGRSTRTVNVLYANLESSIDADDVERANQTDLRTEVFNNGTAYSLETPSDVRILDSDGGTVRSWSPMVPELDPQEVTRTDFEHVFRVPGSYTAQIDVHDTLFPEGSTDEVDFDIIAPDLRGELVNVDEDSRVDTETDFDVVVENAGNLNMSGGTTADVDLRNSQGDVVDEWVVDVPELEEGGTFETTLTSTIEYGGVHTVSLDVHDEDFPYGTQDSDQIIGIGPNLATNVDGSRIDVGDTTDIDVDISNIGSDVSLATTADVTLRNESGDVVAETQLDVPPIEAGERYTEQPFDVVIDEAGFYDVDVDVAPTADTGRATDSDRFEVRYVDLVVDVEATPLSGSNEARIHVTVSNEGTGRSESVDVDSVVTDEGDTIVFSRALSFGELNPGRSQTRSRTVELDSDGLHTVTVEIDEEDGDTDTATFSSMSPNLEGNITATETEVYGLGTDVLTKVRNVGSEASDRTTADITVYDTADGDVVDTSRISVQSLEAGEQQERGVSVNFPGAGVYKVKIDVDDDLYPGNTVDHTEEIHVYQSDLSVRLSANDSDLPPGATGGVEATVFNNGNHRSDPYDIEVEFVSPRGSTIAVEQDTVESIGVGENTTLAFESVLDDIGRNDVIVRVDTTESGRITDSTEIDVSLPLEVEEVESHIPPGEQGVVDATVSNPGAVESETYDVTARFIAPDGSTVSTDSTTVGPIQPGEEETLQFESTLVDAGVHDVIVDVDTGGENKPREGVYIEVVRSELRGQVNARDIDEGDPTDIDIVVDNVGTDVSPETNVTAVLRDPDGNVVADEQYTVGVLEEGESDSQQVFDTELDAVGVYEVEMVGELEGSDDQIQSVRSFEVLYSNLTASVTADDVTRVNEGNVQVAVVNEGTGRSDAAPAQVVIEAPDGSAIRSVDLDVPALSAGRSYSETLEFTTEEAGTHRATVDVEDADRPDGTVAETEFHITWPNLHAHIEAESTTIEDNTATLNVDIENVGPGQSRSTTASVDILGSFGNIVGTRTIDVPPIGSGESHEVSVDHVFDRPGSYFGRIQVQDPEFPEGTTDNTETIDIIHGHLNGEVEFDEGYTVVESETQFEVTVQNVGNDGAAPTTADVWITNANGETVFTDVMEVGSLAKRGSQSEKFTATLNTSGDATAHVDVNYPKFPLGTEDQDDIRVISPDLRADLTIDDVQMGSETTIRVDVTNVGETQAEATTGELLIYNHDMDRVVREEFAVESLAPDESTSIEFVQLIAKECWRTEMSCAPGAELGTAGTFTGSVDISTMFAPEGSEDSDTFYVSED
ncbi:CARDB domain-containing protein [Halohasta litorea]|uniref:CARDB domain-containing protein n=1 Tax=Halohasta litorea TaxID=869891 RepID=A0ABD6DAU7_9EURY|nr:CARDB domain-containing protein [Halohasta litorea]